MILSQQCLHAHKCATREQQKHANIHAHRVPRGSKPALCDVVVWCKHHLHVACGRRDALDISVCARQLGELLLLRALHVWALKHAHDVVEGLRAEVGEHDGDKWSTRCWSNHPFAISTIGVVCGARSVRECATGISEQPTSRATAQAYVTLLQKCACQCTLLHTC